jgi:hypothetical protein
MYSRLSTVIVQAECLPARRTSHQRALSNGLEQHSRILRIRAGMRTQPRGFGWFRDADNLEMGSTASTACVHSCASFASLLFQASPWLGMKHSECAKPTPAMVVEHLASRLLLFPPFACQALIRSLSPPPIAQLETTDQATASSRSSHRQPWTVRNIPRPQTLNSKSSAPLRLRGRVTATATLPPRDHGHSPHMHHRALRTSC